MGEPRVKPTTRRQKFALVLAHLFAVLSVVLCVVWCNGTDTDNGYLGGFDWYDDSLIFQYHVLFMTLGFVFAFTEALLAFRTLSCGKEINKAIHFAWQTIAVILMSVGLRAIFVYADKQSYSDLWSLHSWLGMAVVCLFALNWLVGVVAFVLKLPSEPIRAEILPVHVFLGIALYFAAIFTCETGVVEKLAWTTCSSGYTGIDYSALYSGCKVGAWFGICMLATAVFGTYAVMDTRKAGPDGKGEYEPIPTNAAPALPAV